EPTTRRRWLATALAGGVGVVGIVAALLIRGGSAAPHAQAGEPAAPTTHDSFEASLSSAHPAETSGPAADLAIDAGVSSPSTASSPAVPGSPESTAKRKAANSALTRPGVPPAKGPASSSRGDGVWTER